mgnify:CR=1 FL=1|tara:strand:+ start:56 stop:280 length:225 start_codon:yes stop_codon:yes gene_type:complete
MSLEKLKRVMWLLRERHPGSDLTLKQIRFAIMQEVGADKRTIKKYMDLLKELGWVKRDNYHCFTVTQEGHTETS